MPPDSDFPSSGRSSRLRRIAPANGVETTQILKRASDAPDATVLSGQTPSFRGTQPTMLEVGRALEGTVLGVYELERFVGGGGMGAVFRARDTTLDRTVAVKVLFAQASADDELVRRFRNEAQSAARLDHDNIGRVHAVGYEEGWHFIVFEYIEGRNLRDLVSEEGPFDVPRTVAVAVQVAEALAHASERDVVHRDIKPSNIIISTDGQAKLVDMGLARLQQLAGVDDLTVSGMTLGTFDYISPEQARDPRGTDVRSDLYSLGCTIYFLLAGRPPFAEGTMVQKLLQHQQDPAVPIEQIRPDVPRKLAAAVGKLMEKAPADRYQHPAELVAELAGLADDYGISVAAPKGIGAPTATRTTPWRFADHVPWLVPLVALAAIVASLFWVQGRRGVQPVAGPSKVNDGASVAVPVRAEIGGLAAAVAEARDGDVIELDSTGIRVERPFSVMGKRLVIRAAEGRRPIVRLESSGSEDAAARTGSGLIPIVSGSLTVQGLGIRYVTPSGPSQTRLFVLDGASGLDIRDSTIEASASESATVGATDPSSMIDVVSASGTVQDGLVRTVKIDRSTLSGNATVLQSLGGGLVDVTVVGTHVVTRHRFLVADGGTVSGAVVRLSLDQSSFACEEGFACLLDSPARPMPPKVTVTAKDCRFAIPTGAALVEQSGIEDPEAYQSAVEWGDAGSRYEGSDVFRRIDGDAERVQVEFAAAPVPMEHSSRIGGAADEPATSSSADRAGEAAGSAKQP